LRAIDAQKTNIHKGFSSSTSFISQRKNFLARENSIEKGGGQINEDVQRKFVSRTPRIPKKKSGVG